MSVSYEERKKTILNKLDKEEMLYVPDLAEILNVSTETIRRDLDRLAKEGKLKKVYGGAVKIGPDSVESGEPPFDKKTKINAKEKESICKIAASLVEDGDSILIGSGTTPLEIIRYLGNRKNITLITHSIPVLLLAIDIFKGRLIFIGGEVNTNQKSTEGPLAELMTKQLKANKAFISAGGVSLSDGITDFDIYEANMSRILIERSEKVIVLADHTKIGQTTFAHVCPLRDVSVVISDRHCPQEWRQKLANKGIELLIAD